MGSNFFNNALDFGARFGGLIGRNSTLGKAISNDPIANAIGFENGKGQGPAPVQSGPYAGVTPTLADANAGYQRPAPVASPYQATAPVTPAVGGVTQQPRIGGLTPAAARAGSQGWGSSGY